MNRYTDLSVSQFNPLTLQELMLVPSLKRKQHDDMLDKQDLIASELAKVDPHQKYYGEAKRLKDELDNQMSSMADDLNTNGINDLNKSSFRGMYRKYQNMMSPTGQLGMINNHNAKFKESIAQYYKEGKERGLSQAEMDTHVNESIAKHLDLEQSPLYDNDGRIQEFKVGKGLVDYADVHDRMMKLAQGMGMSGDEIGRAFAKIKYDKDKGLTYVESNSSKKGDSSNDENVRNLAELIKNEVLDPRTKTGAYADYARLDINNILKRIGNHEEVLRKNQTVDYTEQNISNLIQDPAYGDDDVDFGQMYSHNGGTEGLGETFDDAVGNADKILNNKDQNSPQAVQKALLVKEKAQKIEDDLFGNNVPEKNLTQAQKNMRELKAKNENHLAEIKKIIDTDYLPKYKKELEKLRSEKATPSKMDNTLKMLRDLEDLKSTLNSKGLTALENLMNPNDVGSFDTFKLSPRSGQNPSQSGLLNALLDKTKGGRKDFVKNIKILNNAKNDAFSKSGFETTVYTPTLTTTAQNTLNLNTADALSANDLKIQSLTVENPKGDATKINLDANGNYAMMNALKTLGQKDQYIGNNIYSSEDGTIGIQLAVDAKEGENILGSGKYFNSGYSKGDKLVARIPLTEVIDGRTMLNKSAMKTITSLPKSMQSEIKNHIESINSGLYTTSTGDVNYSKPATVFFRNAEAGTDISFKRSKQAGVTPVYHKNGKSSNLRWTDVSTISGGTDFSASNSVVADNYVKIFGNNIPKTKSGAPDYEKMYTRLVDSQSPVTLRYPTELNQLR